MYRLRKDQRITVPNSLALIAAAALVWSIAVNEDAQFSSDLHCSQLQLNSITQPADQQNNPEGTELCESVAAETVGLANQLDLEKRAIDASRKLLFLSAKSVLNRS